LLTAIKKCFYLGAAMLLEAWDPPDSFVEDEFGEALLCAVHSRCRESVAVLLHNRENRVLAQYKKRSVIAQAIEDKSPLLSLIAAYAKDKTLPTDLRGKAKTKFNAAVRMGDIPFPFARIEEELRAILSPWKRIDERNSA
jgi:hypothetical protein